MSVYNGEQYLDDAIDSVLTQDFSDFEFLLIDDASTDRSPEIIQSYAQRDARIRLIENPQNIGLTRSLNKGMRAARAEFVARLDADDIAAPQRFSQQYRYLVKQPECTVVGSVAHLIDVRGQPQGQTDWFSDGALAAQLFFFNSLAHSSVMFRREPILALGGYDDDFTRAQDYDLWLRCLAAGHTIHILPDALTGHRVHGDRVTAKQSEIMEQCRSLALKRGWKNIVGVEVSDDYLDLQQRLLLSEPIADPPSADSVCAEFRRLRRAFASRFADNSDAVNQFDHMVKRLARKICVLVGESYGPYQQYVTGQSEVTFRFQTALRGFQRGVSRARFRIGKWRRGKLV